MAVRNSLLLERSLKVDPTGISAAASRIKRHRQARELNINIHHHYSSQVFTTRSTITGDLVISPQSNVHCATIQIALVGSAHVRLEEVQAQSNTTHHFLNLNMPIPQSAYPPSQVLEAGCTYTIPFNFTIPSHLLPSACSHHTVAKLEHISNYHMQLPPTMGDWEQDDMAPEMSRIKYAIKASVIEDDESKKAPTKVMEASKGIKVLPSATEEPPLNVTSQDKSYVLEKTKTVRKNPLSRSLGRITAVASQANAFYLTSDGRGATPSQAFINLAFEGVAPEVAPPEVESVSARIRAYTYYSGRPVERLPNLGYGREAYSTSASLRSQVVDHNPWVKSKTPTHSKHDKKSSTCYSKTIQVQFDLPTDNKTFLPTFHSCLISRTYTVELKLKIGNTSASLAVPVQILTEAVDGDFEECEMLPSFDQSRVYC